MGKGIKYPLVLQQAMGTANLTNEGKSTASAEILPELMQRAASLAEMN